MSPDLSAEALGEGGSFSEGGQEKKMYFVYLIRSISFPEKTYIGFTLNVKERLKAHNAGESKHTAKFLPWALVTYHAFSEKRKAKEFEYYLKTGSGQAFAAKRFW